MIREIFSSRKFVAIRYIQRRKAWEIWSCAVTSGRQRCMGTVQQRILTSFLVMSVQEQDLKAASIPSVMHGAGHSQVSMQQELLQFASPPVCLPDVIHQISKAFTCCICILQVIKDWRWEWPGNEVAMHFVLVIVCFYTNHQNSRGNILS